MAELQETYDGLEQMPYNLEAEQSVLGAILLDASCMDRVTEYLPRAEYFYQVNNALIYEVMLELFGTGRPVDFVTVLEQLKENSAFDESSGKVYLMQLAQIVPSISNVESYARIVRDKYDIRTLIIAAREILEDAAEGGAEASTLLDSAEQRIFDIRRGRQIFLILLHQPGIGILQGLYGHDPFLLQGCEKIAVPMAICRSGTVSGQYRLQLGAAKNSHLVTGGKGKQSLVFEQYSGFFRDLAGKCRVIHRIPPTLKNRFSLLSVSQTHPQQGGVVSQLYAEFVPV